MGGARVDSIPVQPIQKVNLFDSSKLELMPCKGLMCTSLQTARMIWNWTLFCRRVRPTFWIKWMNRSPVKRFSRWREYILSHHDTVLHFFTVTTALHNILTLSCDIGDTVISSSPVSILDQYLCCIIASPCDFKQWYYNHHVCKQYRIPAISDDAYLSCVIVLYKAMKLFYKKVPPLYFSLKKNL